MSRKKSWWNCCLRITIVWHCYLCLDILLIFDEYNLFVCLSYQKVMLSKCADGEGCDMFIFFYLPVFIPSPGEFFSCGPFAKWNLFGYAKVEVHFWKDLSNCSDSLLLPLVCMHIYLGSNWQCSLLYIRQVMGLFFSDPKSGLC